MITYVASYVTAPDLSDIKLMVLAEGLGDPNAAKPFIERRI